MPVSNGRPPDSITIADCGSAVLYANPAPACPHGKAWRESGYDTMDDALQAMQCDADPPCEATEYRPQAGRSVTFNAARSFKGRHDMMLILRASEAQPDTLEGRAAAIDDSLERAWQLIAANVTAWTWVGAGDQPLPLPNAAGRAACEAALEAGEVMWLSEAIVQRGDPRQVRAERGNGSGASASG